MADLDDTLADVAWTLAGPGRGELVQDLRDAAADVLFTLACRLRRYHRGETWRQAMERRLGACEAHLQHLPPERM